MSGGLFNAHVVTGVQKGTCVLVDDDGSIVYAGALKQAPDVSSYEVLMHAEDFAQLKAIVDRGRH